MDWLSCFASTFGKELVCGAVDELRYPCCFNNFVEELQQKEDNLIATLESVHGRAGQAKNHAMKPAQVIDKWLAEANPLKDEVEDLLKKARTSKSSTCLWHCPNWLWRYHLGKKLANKKVDVEKCNEKGSKYILLERVATLPSIPCFSGDKYLEFDSRKVAYKQLMEAIEDEDVSMIGLYGMGGCGKTTLALELMNTTKHLFDKVLFVPVSSTIDVRSIQDKIASSLQFHFPESEERERAQRLCGRLIQENKILLILDDVWQMLDFDTIGIPTSSTHKGCKVLITTRLETVCTSMDCQRNISLPILEVDEAWALFQKQAHLSESTSDTLKNLARLISDECKGLPVAIAAVASTLKGKSEVEWKVALQRLQNSTPVNVEKGLQNPYKCLQLSYDNLDTEEAKSLLLLCSKYPEDYAISVEELTISAIGLGFGGEVHSYEVTRNEITATKNKLISSCLLLAGSHFGWEYVKMHDLVRDVAHWIGNEKYKNVNGYYSPRYLWTADFPDELDFSNLEYLRISTELEISGDIFKRMGKLRVLILLRHTVRMPLSTMSFKSLTNLRCLSLEKWEIRDFSFLGDMKKLESLVLSHCEFIELPNDVAVTQLKNLRLLCLEGCTIIKNNFEVIARIQLLEELYISDRETSWSDYSENVAELFNKFSVFQGLKRYKIRGGSFRYSGSEVEDITRYQNIFLLSYFHTSYAAAKVLAQRADCLVLEQIEGCAKSFMPDIIPIGGESKNELKVVKISCSKEIEYLIDTSNHLSEVGNLFPELRILGFYVMDHLIALSHGHLPSSGPFQKLEELYLNYCPKFTYLFTHGVARSLAELKTLQIGVCHGLKHILVDDVTEEISPDDNSLVFSKLKHLSVRNCDQIEYIIPVTFAHGLLHLEHLEICSNYALKYAFGRNTHGAESRNELDIIDLPALNYLKLDDLPHTISIFPDNCYPRLPSLLKFDLSRCSEFATKSIKTCRKTENYYEEKKDLGLENLPQLTYICMSFTDPSKFEKLEFLKISGCKKVEVIFHVSVSRCLSELKTLVISNCKELEQIVEEGVENDKLSNLPYQPCFPKLALLIVEECQKLKRFTLVSRCKCNEFPNLAMLVISGASELEELIGCDIGETKVELPKLKYLMFMKLSKLYQGIESQNIRHRLVYNCPKLSLSSTTTLVEFKKQISEDKDTGYIANEVWYVLDGLFYSVETPSEEAQTSSGSESFSSQISEEQEKEVSGSEVLATTTLTDPQLLERPSPSPLDTHLNQTRKQCIDETKRDDDGKDPSLVKPGIPSSGSELREPSPTSLTTPLHKIPQHNQVDQEPNSVPGILDEQHALGESIEIGKERIQEGPAPNETMMKNLSSGVEGIGFGGEGSNLMNKEGGIGVVSSDNIEVPPDTRGSHSLIIAKSGAYKDFVDMDDAQISVLAEAITAYPHLWNVCEKFSGRFQAWMLKTLADMLWFLRNESAFSVTPTREKEFHRLCDEAVQLGFDSSWVDGMRQRVIVKDPKVEHSKARCNELLKKHDQLTQQLHEIKNEINSLNDFLAHQKKCFDFL